VNVVIDIGGMWMVGNPILNHLFGNFNCPRSLLHFIQQFVLEEHLNICDPGDVGDFSF